MLTIQKLPLCAKGAPVAITLENSNYMRVTLRPMVQRSSPLLSLTKTAR